MRKQLALHWALIMVAALSVSYQPRAYAASSDTNFTNVVASGDVTVGGNLSVAGTSTHTGVTTFGSVTATTVTTQYLMDNASHPIMIKRGEIALNSTGATTGLTTVTTGLSVIAAAGVCLKGSATPGVGTSNVIYNSSAGTLSIYSSKVTASNNATLILSSGTETASWWAFGY